MKKITKITLLEESGGMLYNIKATVNDNGVESTTGGCYLYCGLSSKSEECRREEFAFYERITGTKMDDKVYNGFQILQFLEKYKTHPDFNLTEKEAYNLALGYEIKQVD